MIDQGFFPYKQAEENENLKMHVTSHGGHVGFVQLKDKYFWSEKLMLSFFDKVLNGSICRL